MKRFIGAVALLAVTSTQAAELKFGDLNYFLQQGKSNLAGDISWQTEERTVKTNPGKETTETEGAIFNAKYAHALSDNLNFFVGLAYSVDVEVTPEGGSKYQQDGLHNPSLGLNYRAISQIDSSFNLDLGVAINVGLQDERLGNSSGSIKKDGNASKRSSLDLNARLGKKWDEANEVYTLVNLAYNQSGEQTQRQATSSEITNNYDSSMDLTLGAFYQYRPVNEFMLTLGAQATRVGKTEGDANGTGFDVDGHMDYKFTFSAKYLITENFIARFNYTGARMNDYTVNYSGASDTDVENRRFMAWGLGVDYLF